MNVENLALHRSDGSGERINCRCGIAGNCCGERNLIGLQRRLQRGYRRLRGCENSRDRSRLRSGQIKQRREARDLIGDHGGRIGRRRIPGPERSLRENDSRIQCRDRDSVPDFFHAYHLLCAVEWRYEMDGVGFENVLRATPDLTFLKEALQALNIFKRRFLSRVQAVKR